MKQLTIILLGLIGIAYGQSSPTSAKTRFVNGLYVGTKLDSYFNAADSNAIYWRADSVVMAKYKGTARALAFAVSGGYIPYSDTTSLFSQVVRTFGTQTVGGRKTFSNDIVVNGISAGVGAGGLVGNTVFGRDAFRDNTTGGDNTAIGNGVLLLNTTGSSNTGLGHRALFSSLTANGNTAIGYRALNATTASNNTAVGNQSLVTNTSGSSNTSVGSDAMNGNTTGSQNVAVGQSALNQNTTASTNTGIGYQALLGTTTGGGNTALGHNSGTTNSTGTNNTYIGISAAASANNRTNETVIGASATGNGSNTVTIGNSSVTDNYFSGNINAARLLLTTSSAVPIVANSTNTNGGYISIQKSGTDQVYIGNSEAISGASNNIDISARSGKGLTFYTNGSTAPALNITTGNFITTSEDTQIGNSVAGRKFIVFGGTAGSTYPDLILYGASSDNNWTLRGNHSTDFSIGKGTFGDYGTTIFSVASSGAITSLGTYNATVGGTNRDVFVDNTGLIGYVSSFRASKKNISPISNTDWLHNLNPVTFNYRVKDSLGNYTDSSYKELEYGLVAEEVETVNKEMVFYDVDSVGNKKLRGVHYSKLIIPLLAEAKEHKKKLDEQQTIIEALLTRIKALEAKLN